MESLSLLMSTMEHQFPKLAGLSMLELGSQDVHDKTSKNYKPFTDYGFVSEKTVASKYFFQHLGIVHTSVDLNGFDSSLALDCRKPLLLPGRYDVIVNIGFTEHRGGGFRSKSDEESIHSVEKHA